jgi:hypothetical protein
MPNRHLAHSGLISADVSACGKLQSHQRDRKSENNPRTAGNVWSAAGLQGKFGREDESAQMYAAFGWRLDLLARMSCARVCPLKSVGCSSETITGIRLRTRRCDCSFVLTTPCRLRLENSSRRRGAGKRERVRARCQQNRRRDRLPIQAQRRSAPTSRFQARSLVLSRNLDRSLRSTRHSSIYSTVPRPRPSRRGPTEEPFNRRSPLQPPRQRPPSNGPIKTAPREILRRSSRHARGSPDRVLSFRRTLQRHTRIR